LGSEPGARFTSEPRKFIVARSADAVDVTGNSDRQRGLSAVTTSSLRRSHAFRDDGGLSWFALADSRLTTSFGRCSIPAATKARVGGLAPHELRHMCGSPAIRSQASITTAQRLVGHATATMTLDNYGHLYPDELDQVAQPKWLRVCVPSAHRGVAKGKLTSGFMGGFESFDSRLHLHQCAISSAGERFPDTEEVTGSIPVSRTSVYAGQSMYLDSLSKTPRQSQDNAQRDRNAEIPKTDHLGTGCQPRATLMPAYCVPDNHVARERHRPHHETFPAPR
jgi:hypothetical protein